MIKNNLFIASILLLLNSFTSAQDTTTLNSDYNIYRITGGTHKEVSNSFDLYINREYLSNTFSFYDRSGKSDSYQVGARFYNLTIVGNYFANFTGLKNFDWRLRTHEAHQLYIDISIPKGYVYYAEEFGTGFEADGEVFQNHYQSKLLTNEGKITLSQEENELAFLFGPQLDKGQYRHEINFDHNLIENWDINELIYDGSFGITTSHEIGFEYSNSKHISKKINIDDYFNYGSYDTTHVDTTTISYSYRNKTLWVNTDLYTSIQDPETGGEITIGYLLNKRGITGNEVNGNWDKYFNHTLGKNQLLSSVSYKIGSNNLYGDESYYYTNNDANINIQYGLLKTISLGTDWKYIWNEIDFLNNTQEKTEATVDITISNVPLRVAGPSQVSSKLYNFGYIPTRNQIRAKVLYTLPFEGYEKSLVDENSGQNYYSVASAIEEVSETLDNLDDNSNFNLSLQYGFTNKLFCDANYAIFLESEHQYAKFLIGSQSNKSILTFSAVMLIKPEYSYSMYDDNDETEISFGPFNIDYKYSF